MEPSVIIGLWPLSGDYGSIFSQRDISEFLETCSELGLEVDNAESYGDLRFQEYIGVVARNSDLKISTKIRVLPDMDMESVRVLCEKVVEKYGAGLECCYIHNPQLQYSKLIDIVEYIKAFFSTSPTCVGVSWRKDADVLALKVDAQRHQIDLNPSFFEHADKLRSYIPGDLIFARSVFGSGLLASDSLKIVTGDQRFRWVSDKRLKNASRFMEILRSEGMSKKEIVEGLLQFPMAWGIRNLIVGTSRIDRVREMAKIKSITWSETKALKEKLIAASTDLEIF